MGFADELRNAPSKRQQEEQRQLEEDWELIAKLFINYIKRRCRWAAESGYNESKVSMNDCIDDLEEQFTSSYTNGYDESSLVIEYDYSEEGRMWERIRDRFYHYTCEEEQVHTIPYPNMRGMSLKDATVLSERLKESLQGEGLNVVTQLRKEYEKVRFEDKYVKHTSKIEKMLTGTEGHYEKQYVTEEQMYSFAITVSW